MAVNTILPTRNIDKGDATNQPYIVSLQNKSLLISFHVVRQNVLRSSASILSIFFQFLTAAILRSPLRRKSMPINPSEFHWNSMQLLWYAGSAVLSDVAVRQWLQIWMPDFNHWNTQVHKLFSIICNKQETIYIYQLIMTQYMNCISFHL